MSDMRKLLLVIRFSFLRMLRDLPSVIPLLFVPMLIIPIIGTVFAKIAAYSSYLKGAADPMAFFAIGLVIMFQLFGGRYSTDYVKDALLSDRKWRMVAAPCRPTLIVTGILAASTVVSLLEGILLVTFTRVLLGVRWGDFAVVVAVLLGTTLLSQLVNLALLLATRNYNLAAALSWFYAWGGSALGGLIFPLPTDRPFWRFMVTYGTPYSLAQTAVIGSASGGARADVALCIGVLFAAAALVMALVALFGRRRLA
jgi:ABC-2 type transport system permease protein